MSESVFSESLIYFSSQSRVSPTFKLMNANTATIMNIINDIAAAYPKFGTLIKHVL